MYVTKVRLRDFLGRTDSVVVMLLMGGEFGVEKWRVVVRGEEGEGRGRGNVM